MNERLTITIPLFLTDHPHTKTAISLPELVRETSAFSKKYRPGCSPKLLDSNPKALFLHYNVKCNKKDSDPSGHDVRVQFDITKVQESQQAKDLDVQISCSCPAFLYWGAQWNLHQRDGLLGNPRPKLVAPTERLDLRANFVICKHVHSVFERILPSVQHNIVKILREREVRRNKDKVRETPARLKKLQDELRLKHEKEKIRKIKDKTVRDKMLESLKGEEQSRLMHEQELKNRGKAPGEVEREGPAMEPEELEVTEEVPAQALPEEGEEEDLSAIQDLLDQEEDKIEEAHDEGKPHIHKGLPYDIEPEDDDKIIRKFESRKEPTKFVTPENAKPGTRVYFVTAYSMGGTIKKVEGNGVTVQWDNGWEKIVPIGNLRLLRPEQQKMFASHSIQVPGIGRLEIGMKVIAITPSKMVRGQIVDIERNKESPQFSRVSVREADSNMVGIHRADLIRLTQRSLFAAKPNEIQPGDTVWFDANPKAEGRVLEIRLNKKVPQKSIIKADWGELGIHEMPIHRVRTAQRPLFAAKSENLQPSVMFRLRPGTRVTLRPEMKAQGTVRKVTLTYGGDAEVTVRWDDGHTSTVENWTLVEDKTQRKLFASTEGLRKILLRFQPGTRVKFRPEFVRTLSGQPPTKPWGTVHKIVPDPDLSGDAQVTVEWDEGYVSTTDNWRLVEDKTQQKLFAAAGSPLKQFLHSLRPQIASEAQKIYDEWTQDESGVDEEYGAGGICDAIASRIMDFLYPILEGKFGPDCEYDRGGQDGDDHEWLMIFNDKEAFGIDIPHALYERGGGYSWTKIPGAVFRADDVEIWEINRSDVEQSSKIAARPRIVSANPKMDLQLVEQQRLFAKQRSSF
jgi:hypothetical protein